jgi:hypothetical protein
VQDPDFSEREPAAVFGFFRPCFQPVPLLGPLETIVAAAAQIDGALSRQPREPVNAPLLVMRAALRSMKAAQCVAVLSAATTNEVGWQMFNCPFAFVGRAICKAQTGCFRAANQTPAVVTRPTTERLRHLLDAETHLLPSKESQKQKSIKEHGKKAARNPSYMHHVWYMYYSICNAIRYHHLSTKKTTQVPRHLMRLPQWLPVRVPGTSVG